ncbi:MAG: urea transporter [Bacteroidetes bacterium]|nr:urea transporter [Bacteroidota bacterium]
MTDHSLSYTKPQYWLRSTVNSYAVVFFSTNPWFGALLILASFVNPMAGLCGLLGTLLANAFATVIGLNQEHVYKGYYGYDAMLVACALGTFYQVNAILLVLIVCVAMLAVFLSQAISGIMHKYQLPALSFPFLLTIWLVLLAIASVSGVEVIAFRSSLAHAAFGLPPMTWEALVNSLDSWQIPALVKVYFKSLSALFFQSNVLSGVLITVGLLAYSRIAFSLSVVGYMAAYYFYGLLGGSTSDFYENFIGLNFIFQAIAIGGFFLVPSLYSYLATIVLTPVLIIVVFACNKLMGNFGLLSYSLPFTIVTILFLYLLKFRTHIRYLHLVSYQTFSPEQNLYNYLDANLRMRLYQFFPVHLPFWGEWMVSQAHDGKITHLGQWSKAFDFIILDDEMKSYRNPGLALNDFYCYDKPVVACGDGYVVALEDKIDDNLVNDVNTIQNWGNTIVIKHTEGLFSQLSHLKKDSLKVKVGDYVRRGDLIALCGNSGRSPEPHIHFQMQAQPAIGSPTLDYPLAYYMVKHSGRWELKTYDKPTEGQSISSVQTNTLLKSAFNLTPGTRLKFVVKEEGRAESETDWEVFTDSYNYSYLYCHQSKAIAYFYNDGNLFYFTNYIGDTEALLYYFYLAHYKVLLGYYHGLQIRETYPSATIRRGLLSFVQDFITPFYRLVHTEYSIRYVSIDDENISSEIKLESEAEIRAVGLSRKALVFQTTLRDHKISEFQIRLNQRKITALCVNT